MDQREQIRRDYFVEGKSIRQIAREKRHDRRTVRKSLHDAGPPRYTLRVPRRRPVLEPFLTVIDQWLREDEGRPPKQRHTAHRIHLIELRGHLRLDQLVRYRVNLFLPKGEYNL